MITSLDAVSGLHSQGVTAPAQLPYSKPCNFPSSLFTIHKLTMEMRHVILRKHKISIMQMGPGSWLINGSYQDNGYFYIFINTAPIFSIF